MLYSSSLITLRVSKFYHERLSAIVLFLITSQPTPFSLDAPRLKCSKPLTPFKRKKLSHCKAFNNLKHIHALDGPNQYRCGYCIVLHLRRDWCISSSPTLLCSNRTNRKARQCISSMPHFVKYLIRRSGLAFLLSCVTPTLGGPSHLEVAQPLSRRAFEGPLAKVALPCSPQNLIGLASAALRMLFEGPLL